ncbi:hypothetical protein LRS71_00600 [Rhodococcus pyridinivorans]|uniref:hypothetical protein n=1 Tax=Rhodococcus pyridinivorans TaxID=103816 RepID=UPI001E2CF23D|nr:hypothetical protein [Rhodococcus pyridinivorans]MCD5418084.1 hypothetical protein [Rhodococcus pyridinivorans]
MELNHGLVDPRTGNPSETDEILLVESAIDDRALLGVAHAAVEGGSAHRGDQGLDEMRECGMAGHG